MNIREYVDSNSQAERMDFEEHIFENIFAEFCRILPLNPSLSRCDVWTDGTEILCRSESIANLIADALDTIAGERLAHTGYYDPHEDELSGETDDYTGWWYVDYD